MLEAVFHFAGALIETLDGRPEGWKGSATAFPVEVIVADVFHPGSADPAVERLENHPHLMYDH